MKVTCDSNILKKGFHLVESVISSSNLKPILQNVKITAYDNRLELSTTDLEVSITYHINPLNISVPGTIVCPEHKISSVVKEWKNNTIDLIENERVCEITGKDGYFKILCATPEDFPHIPNFIDEDFIEIDSQVFAEMIKKTMFIALADKTKTASSGIFFDIDGNQAKMVTNDGRRLAEIKRKINNSKEQTKSCVIPIKSASQILKILVEGEESVKVKIDEKRILIRTENVTLSSQLIDGSYPNYEKVIPSDLNKTSVLNRAEFISAVRKGAIMTVEDYKLLCFKFFNNMLEIKCLTPDVGEARLSMEIEYTDEELEIGFNPDYILDFLRVVEDNQVQFDLKDKGTAGIFRIGNQYQYMLMPLKLREIKK
ncbi:MAG: DNA polymerase III subunit beta [Candidatus Scalindua sp.]|nr:DNA polymerase III subunit beta [Planctomycetota bacterium]GJQ57988.1 MAG: DNA polymerase III subunit beta [Candidatus Scalindua sp.]